jgi:uncharacterized protein YaiI (UPF0178 family)
VTTPNGEEEPFYDCKKNCPMLGEAGWEEEEIDQRMTMEYLEKRNRKKPKRNRKSKKSQNRNQRRSWQSLRNRGW